VGVGGGERGSALEAIVLCDGDRDDVIEAVVILGALAALWWGGVNTPLFCNAVAIPVLFDEDREKARLALLVALWLDCSDIRDVDRVRVMVSWVVFA